MATEAKPRRKAHQRPIAGFLRSRTHRLIFAAAITLSGCSVIDDAITLPQSSGTPDPITTVTPATETGAAIYRALAAIQVAPVRRRAPGYDRSCGGGRACSFGQAWTDDHHGVDGHDGCDTRNNVLRRQLHSLNIKPGTRGCVVLAGEFTDPYTGRRITFHKAEARKVQIDHIYPLAKAWDLGASRWPADRRTDFANDVQLNLLAVDGSANASKGDDDLGDGPGEWLPLNKGYRCTYVLRFLEVARTYQLPITREDRGSALTIAPGCS